MKIVISTDIYYPMINGVAVFSRNLAMGMSQRGHDVVVLAPSIDGDFHMEKDAEGGFRVARLPSFKMPFYPDQINDVPEAKKFFGKQIPKLLYRNGLHVSLNPYPEIKKVLDDFKPDLIHDQTPGPVALAVYRYAKKHDISIVATSHAYPDNLTSQLHVGKIGKKTLDVVMQQYFTSFLRRSAYATMPTELAMDDLLPKKRRRFKVPVEAISNGVDLSKFHCRKTSAKFYEKYGIDMNKRTVLYVGRIDPEKTLHKLLEAFALANRKCKNSQLVLVGDGTDKSRLESAAEELGIRDDVVFVGRVIGKDLPELYTTGDVFGISSSTETQGIVVIEAMASSLPVVAVRGGAVEELVHHKRNGFLHNADDIEGFARSLRNILEHPKLQKKMGAESKKIVKKHDLNQTLQRMEEIYTEVVRVKKEEGYEVYDFDI